MRAQYEPCFSDRALSCPLSLFSTGWSKETRDWRPLAWYIHDHLPYSEMVFFAKNAAFNLTWREQKPKRKILSRAQPCQGL